MPGEPGAEFLKQTMSFYCKSAKKILIVKYPKQNKQNMKHYTDIKMMI